MRQDQIRRSDAENNAGRVVKTLERAGLVVALIISGVTLAYDVWPAIRPDPGEALAARIDVATVEPDVTFGQYLRRTRAPLDTADRSDRRARGNVVFLRIQIKGRKDGNLELHQVLYQASTGRRIRGQAPTQDAYFQPDTPNDQWIYPVFVLRPPHKYPVFVRLELFDGDLLMAFADTPPLRLRGDS